MQLEAGAPLLITEVVAAEHTDEVGHFNHVAAVRFMEMAREAWYQACGLHAETPSLYGTVVVNINYDYRAECFEGDRLTVRVTPGQRGNKSFTLVLAIIRPDGAIAVEGTSTNVVMRMSDRAIVPVPECLARHLAPRVA